jgi:tRNA threonylcarbamoyladenosine biosynthesis protein TsaB
MIVLGFDTATRSTVVALRMADGSTLQARDDPAPDEHPGHATRLLGMANQLLGEVSIGWSGLERIAVGLGPGTFTGLRVGVATARGLAQSLDVELVGASSLRALAEPGLHSEPESARVLAVLDARRGEVFVAAYGVAAGGSVEELAPPRALAPEDLGEIVEQVSARREDGQSAEWRAVGDGAVRFRGQLQDAGVTVPRDSSPLHLLSGQAICALGASGAAVAVPTREAILPDYCRRPDAEISLERKQASVAPGPEGAHPATEGVRSAVDAQPAQGPRS